MVINQGAWHRWVGEGVECAGRDPAWLFKGPTTRPPPQCHKAWSFSISEIMRLLVNEQRSQSGFWHQLLSIPSRRREGNHFTGIIC